MFQENISLRYQRVNSILPKTVINDQYLILSGLGKGTFGKVYLAQNYKTKELVAIKALNMENASEQQLQNIKLEEEILKQLYNPNIIKLLQVIKEKTITYLILEYIFGKTLSDYFKSKKCQLALIEIQTIAKTLLKILEYLLQKGVVHHDIKLSNILIQDDKPLDKLQLIDFGLASTFSQKEDKVKAINSIGGSLAFMPPELFNANQVYNQKLDIWSIGIVIYMLANNNQHPFCDIKSDKSILTKFYRKATKITLPKKNLPFKLHNLLKKMLKLNPAKRISVVDALKHPFFEINYEMMALAPTFEQLIFEQQSQPFIKIMKLMFLVQYVKKRQLEIFNKFKSIMESIFLVLYCKRVQNQKKIQEKSKFKINTKILTALQFPNIKHTPLKNQRNIFLVNSLRNVFFSNAEQAPQPTQQKQNLDQEELSQSDTSHKSKEENVYQLQELKPKQISNKNLKILQHRIKSMNEKKQFRGGVQNLVQINNTSNIMKNDKKKITSLNQIQKQTEKQSSIDQYFSKYSVIANAVNQTSKNFATKRRQNMYLSNLGSSQDFSSSSFSKDKKIMMNQKTFSQFKLPRIKSSANNCL